MEYMCKYETKKRKIVLLSDGNSITGLWFDGQKNFYNVYEEHDKELEIFRQTKKWLDIYFSGKKPTYDIPVLYTGTEFRKRVWEILEEIPYGETMTYGEIAKKIADEKKMKKMSAQAVGNAVSKNPISILVPCHRVIGNNNNLTGYAGGIEKKIELLKLEGIDVEKYYIPDEK